MKVPAAVAGHLSRFYLPSHEGFAARWLFSPRHIDNLLAQGLPYLKIGERRVRIIVAEGDAWMKTKFTVSRRGPLQPKAAKAA